MENLKLDVGENRGPLEIDDIAEKIYRQYEARKIKSYSRDYEQFRIACSDQLQSLSKDQVKEISKILLLKHDLRVLGYELIYYHKS